MSEAFSRQSFSPILNDAIFQNDSEKWQSILDAFNQGHPVPSEAINQALANQKEITPILLARIQQVADNPSGVDFEKKDDLLAIYLLSQFREKKAFPIFITIAKFPADFIELYFNDLSCEIDRFIVSMYDGNLDLIKSLIEDKNANLWCRASAIDSLLGLFVLHELTRDEIVSYFKYLLSTDLLEDTDFVSFLAYAIFQLHPQELYHELIDLFNRGLIDESLFGAKEEVDKQIARGRDACLQDIYGRPFFKPIDDVVHEVQWLYIQQDNEQSLLCGGAWEVHGASTKIGRNEPCPCGSAKKYKKCCLM